MSAHRSEVHSPRIGGATAARQACCPAMLPNACAGRTLLALFLCLTCALSHALLPTDAAAAPGAAPSSFVIEPVYKDKAPLWAAIDPDFQRELEEILTELKLDDDAAEKRLGIALVDMTNPEKPLVAAINPDEMMYAASLPKIAVLLAAFEQIEVDRLPYDDEMVAQLTRMIRFSSNQDASVLMDRVGKAYIAEILTSAKYRLYDPRHGGGLWAGKNYGTGGVWRRDPIKNLSHAATPMQIARFYYMLARGDLVSPGASRAMRQILAASGIRHKFVAGMNSVPGDARVHRKSGSWSNWHADSALIEHRGRTFIAVGLCDDPHGGDWLEDLIVEFDELIRETPVPGEQVHWVRRSAPSPALASLHR
jgi:beta-lactamase class A